MHNNISGQSGLEQEMISFTQISWPQIILLYEYLNTEFI